MGQRVHAHMEVGDVHAHGLLAHSRLVCVTRRLIMIGERNNGRTYTWRQQEWGDEESNGKNRETNSVRYLG